MSQANAALRSWMRGRTCADAGGRIGGGSSVAGRRGFSYAVKRSAWLCSVACETHKTLTTPDRTHTLEMHARHADELQPR